MEKGSSMEKGCYFISPYISIVILMLLMILGDVLSSCPLTMNYNCTCVHLDLDDDDSQLINCTSTALTSVPSDLPSYANMKFEDNHMPVLDYIAHPQLKKLTLESNDIRFIRDFAFRDLSNLMELRLSNNRISGLSSNTFTGLANIHGLYLRNNLLYQLDNYTFSGDKMPYLNILVLSNCQLFRISTGAFAEAKNLHLLDLSANSLTSPATFLGHLNLNTLNLSSNMLQSLAGAPFQYLEELQKLFIANNQLHNIMAQDFQGLSYLIHLSLSNNSISYVHTSAFDHMKLLTDLDLSSNHLSSLDSECIPWASVQKLHLEENPWNCGCKTQWLHVQDIVIRWNLEYNIRCASPSNVAGKHVFSVSDHVFDCPHGHNITIGVIIGIVAGIICTIIGSLLLYKVVVKNKLTQNVRSRTNGVSVTTSSYSRVQDSRELFDSCVESNVT